MELNDEPICVGEGTLAKDLRNYSQDSKILGPSGERYLKEAKEIYLNQ